MSPIVSIITVNFNEPEVTYELLDSLASSTYREIEVIVIDNGSTEKLDRAKVELYDRVSYIWSENNLGFAGGNNLGVAKAKGDYLLFLNNDTVVSPNFIQQIVEVMEKNPKIGMASPKVIYPDGRIQYAGAKSINPITGRGKRLGLFEDDNGQYDYNIETGLPHGAALIIRSEIVDVVGNMPEEYFLYYEEHDWCEKIKRAGYKMYYLGQLSIVHKESVSVGEDSPLKVYYINRNRILYLIRNSSGIKRVSGILFYCSVALPKISLQYLLKGRLKQLKSLWRGVLWHINKSYDFKH